MLVKRCFSKNMNKTLENLDTYILSSIIFLLPLTFLPVFPNAFITAKLALLIFGISAILVVKALRIVSKGTLELGTGAYSLPLLILAFSYLLSSIVKTPNKMEAFFLPGTTTLILGGVLMYFFTSAFKESDRAKLKLFIFISGILAAVFGLIAASAILAKVPELPALLKDPLFNTEGSALGLFGFLVITLPIGIELALNSKDLGRKVFYFTAITIITLELAICFYNLLPGRSTSPTFAPWDTSWSVAIDSLKESPVLGIGPANFLTAFNRFLPISYNGSSLWATRFSSAHDFFLTALAETGFLGFAALILLVISVYKNFNKDINERRLVGWNVINFPLVSLTLALIMLAIFPATFSVIILLFVLLAISAPTKTIKYNLSATGTEVEGKDGSWARRIPAIIVVVPIVAATAFLDFNSGKFLTAEAKFQEALNALAQNDGLKTYNILISAITINPYVDRYRSVNSDLNLTLAKNLAQKKDLTDSERDSVTQLVQQAISEAKAAVYLNPGRSANWELLARTYQSLMSLAQDADTYTIQTYNQAIALDPSNPNLRLTLGGIYYSLKRYDDAIDTLKFAVIAKPDLANSHYNLALAYRDKGDINRAIDEMTTVLSLVKKNSNDFTTAKTELDNLEKQKPAGTPTPTPATKNETPPSTLSTPAPAENPILEPPLELPKDATPPAISPSPTPLP
jgi:tetratricopeptide (TPR) repeat protein